MLEKSNQNNPLNNNSEEKEEPPETDPVILWENGHWENRDLPVTDEERQGWVRFRDIKYYYANIIDYTRVIMCILASFTIVTPYHLVTAFLIYGSILLDWLDGPIARAYNQCTIFGSGVDWLADVLGTVIMMAWWVVLDSSVLPWTFLMVVIEATCCVFDFATMATYRYPRYTARGGFFFSVVDYSMPENAYTHFGTITWLAYPTFATASCLVLAYQPTGVIFFALKALIYLSFVPSVIYGWCELAYAVHMVQLWREPRYDHMGKVPVHTNGEKKVGNGEKKED